MPRELESTVLQEIRESSSTEAGLLRDLLSALSSLKRETYCMVLHVCGIAQGLL